MRYDPAQTSFMRGDRPMDHGKIVMVILVVMALAVLIFAGWVDSLPQFR
ncbi:hypothetical protein [Caenispirillum salinarum]